MSRDKTSVSPNTSFTFTKFLTTAVILGLVFTGYNNNTDLAKVVESKNEIIAEQTLKYNNLLSEHQKSQALIQATTEEVKRLSNELKEYKNISNQELIFTEETTTLGSNMTTNAPTKDTAKRYLLTTSNIFITSTFLLPKRSNIAPHANKFNNLIG